MMYIWKNSQNFEKKLVLYKLQSKKLIKLKKMFYSFNKIKSKEFIYIVEFNYNVQIIEQTILYFQL